MNGVIRRRGMMGGNGMPTLLFTKELFYTGHKVVPLEFDAETNIITTQPNDLTIGTQYSNMRPYPINDIIRNPETLDITCIDSTHCKVNSNLYSVYNPLNYVLATQQGVDSTLPNTILTSNQPFSGMIELIGPVLHWGYVFFSVNVSSISSFGNKYGYGLFIDRLYLYFTWDGSGILFTKCITDIVNKNSNIHNGILRTTETYQNDNTEPIQLHSSSANIFLVGFDAVINVYKL